MLRELSRRWGARVLTAAIEDPTDVQLDALGVDYVPAWLKLQRAARDPAPRAPDGENTEHGREVDLLTVLGVSVDPEAWAGAWRIVHQRSGALPKHVVHEEFGPRGD